MQEQRKESNSPSSLPGSMSYQPGWGMCSSGTISLYCLGSVRFLPMREVILLTLSLRLTLFMQLLIRAIRQGRWVLAEWSRLYSQHPINNSILPRWLSCLNLSMSSVYSISIDADAFDATATRSATRNTQTVISIAIVTIYNMEQRQEKLYRVNDILGTHSFVQKLGKKYKERQQVLSRQTYNRDARNIKQFTKEWKSFKKKMEYKPTRQTDQAPPKTPKRFGVPLKYEQNQTLELQHTQDFEFEPKPLPYRARRGHHRISQNNSLKPIYTEGSVESSIGKGQEWGGVSSLLQLRRRMLTVGRQPMKKVFTPTRFRHMTTWGKNNQRTELNTEPLKDKYARQEPLLDFAKDRTARYIRSLHRLQWSCEFLRGKTDMQTQNSPEYYEHCKSFKWSQDSPINAQSVCYMISRRYQLLISHLEDHYEVRARELNHNHAQISRQKLCDQTEYGTLSGLKRKSILDMIGTSNTPRRASGLVTPIEIEQKEDKVVFSLPYSEFISYREARKTVYQLITMSHKMYLRMAFVLLDKNRNQLIDESDLLHLIGISRSLPLLTKDALVIAKALLEPSAALKPFFRSINKSTLGQAPKLAKKGTQTQSDMKDEKEDMSSQPTQRISNRFKIEKLYTFLTEKEQVEVSSRRQKSQEPTNRSDSSPRSSPKGLNFQAFCAVFRHRMPFIIYDMLQYMFGATLDDFHPRIKNELKNQPIRQKRNKVSYNKIQETLQEKWNSRLIETNKILEEFLHSAEGQVDAKPK